MAMTSDGSTVERLRDYLRAPKPAARAMLVAELERAMLRGEQDSGSELILQELRRGIREASRAHRHTAQLFFAPFESFLVDDAADHKRLGRLARFARTDRAMDRSRSDAGIGPGLGRA